MISLKNQCVIISSVINVPCLHLCGKVFACRVGPYGFGFYHGNRSSTMYMDERVKTIALL